MVGPLCAREDHGCGRWRSGSGRWQAHLNALVSHEMDASPPMFSPAPISPEERGRTNREWMQQHTHLARLCRGTAIPLALLTQGTGTTTPNARSIHHAQASVGFSALLMREQRLFSRTPQRSIGLETKVLA